MADNNLSFDLLSGTELADLFNEDFSDLTCTQLMGIPTQDLLQNQIPEATANSSSTRFAPSISPEEIRKRQQEGVPKKTRMNTQWGIGLWSEWAENRNKRTETALEPGFPIPVDIKEMSTNVSLLDYWMQRFVLEIRRKDGNPYPPNTLYQIVCAIQRYLKSEGYPSLNFFKNDDNNFSELRKTLDARMKELTACGIGLNVKQADPVTKEDEHSMWTSGVFNLETSSGLSNAVFFYNGKVFGFRGCQEHIDCKAEQFQIGYDHANKTKYVSFTPRVRKNSQGGLQHRKVDVSPIVHYENDANERSVVKIFEKYLDLIPRKGPFYRKPLGGVDENGNLRYSCACIPQTHIRNTMKKLFQEANISTDGRRISNHSARVTLCTTLYNDKFADKSIISRSKHRSNAVQAYQREDFKTLTDISNTLDSPHTVAPCETRSGPSGQNIKTETAVSATEHCEDDALTIFIPKTVKKIILVKDGRKIAMDI